MLKDYFNPCNTTIDLYELVDMQHAVSCPATNIQRWITATLDLINYTVDNTVKIVEAFKLEMHGFHY